jgi:hypothetical protein
MAQHGKPSTAHEYDEQSICIHCGMYRSNVERMSHVCKPWRELKADKDAADKADLSLEEYRRGE